MGGELSAVSLVRPLVLQPVFGPQATVAPGEVAPRLFILSGQGTQQKGMGKDLYAKSGVFRAAIDEANDGFREDLAAMGEPDTTLMEVMFQDVGLQRTQRTQVALVACDVGLGLFLESEGLGPRPGDLIAGHSVNEWGAYSLAKRISLHDAVRVVHWRGYYMEKTPIPGEGSMMTSFIDSEARKKLGIIFEVCRAVMAEHDGWIVQPALVNSAEQVNIAGHPAAVAEVTARLRDQFARAIAPAVVRPFHTPLMTDAKNSLAEKLGELGIVIGPDQGIGVLANLTGKRVAAGEDPMQVTLDGIDNAVLWADSMQEAIRLGVTAVVVLAVGNDLFWNLNLRNFRQVGDPTMFNAQYALHRAYMRWPAAVVRTELPTPSRTEADRRLLADSYAAGAAYRRVMQLAESGDFATALLVLDNPMRVVREAGLRALMPYKDQDEVAAAMVASGFDWPAPTVRDLPTVSLEDKTVADLRTLYDKLDKLAVAPIEFEDLTYYVASRLHANPAGLALIMKLLTYLAGQESAKLKLLRWGPTVDVETGERIPDMKREQGVDEWEKVVQWLDPQIKFSPLGALKQEDL